MKQTERPIAVFDSGVGGISVLRELVRLMPNENYIFFGDSKNAPYGGKSLEEVRELTECHVKHLLSEGAKAVVIACNTATSADVSILRKEYPDVPVVGIEPALKPAVQFMEHPRVLVMATPMTIREEKFHRLMARYEKDAEIYPLACPGIVEFVERGELNSAGLKAFLYRLLKPYCEGTVDAIVLGCTPLSFCKGCNSRSDGKYGGIFLMEELVWHGRPDGGLWKRNYCIPEDRKGRVIFENSAATLEKLRLCEILLNSK